MTAALIQDNLGEKAGGEKLTFQQDFDTKSHKRTV